MAQLVATALTMVNAPADEVRTALADYENVRRNLVTDEFGAYEVLAGGQGVGTEVRWTLALDEAIRNRKGKRPRKQKRPPKECLIRVDEADGERIVERDTRSSLVTVWTVQAAEDDRTAVRVNATWDHAGGLFTRQSEQLGMRSIYESLLTKLHDHFEVESAAEPEPRDTGPDDGEAGAGPEADARAEAVQPPGTEPEVVQRNSTPDRADDTREPEAGDSAPAADAERGN